MDTITDSKVAKRIVKVFNEEERLPEHIEDIIENIVRRYCYEMSLGYSEEKLAEKVLRMTDVVQGSVDMLVEVKRSRNAEA